MTTGPGLFADFGRKAKDVLMGDYLLDRKLYSYGGRVRLLKLSIPVFQWLHEIGFCYNSEIEQSTWTTATLKLPNFSSSKLEVQYFQPNVTCTIASALNQTNDISATIGTPTFSLGAKARYETTSSKFTKYAVGINVTRPDSCASIIMGGKGDTLKVSYVHHLDELKKNAIAGEMTRRLSTNENSFTVGGTYEVDELTVVKAKLNNHGKLGAVLKCEVNPYTDVTVSTELDTKALKKTPRFSVFISLKL